MTTLRIGYVALTDAAVLIAAAEVGFARAEGLELILEREESWAAIRDKLVYGFIDGAHLLAPLAIATSLGLSGVKAPLAAPFALNLNGNAITVSTALWREMAEHGAGEDARSAALALGAVARRRRARGADPLTVATVFPFSTHTCQLRLFLAAGDLAFGPLVRLATVPPVHMVEALRTGAADGICVGSPWNSVAVELGFGRIVALGTEIVPDCPEKVLALPRASAESAAWAGALVRALGRAAAWCADAGHRGELARLLGKREHLDLDPALIRRSLDGRLIVDAAGTLRIDPAYLALGGEAHRPRPEHARWLVERMIEAGQAQPADRERAAAIYRPDLYEAALREPA